MTKKEFQTNYRSLVRKTTEMLLEYEKAALKSGAFDLKPEDTPFRLPKDVLTAALEDIIPQWAPHSWNRAERKRVKNIQMLTYPDWSQC